MLRIYYRTNDVRPDQEDKIKTLVRRACDASADISEMCGAPGELDVLIGWYRTRCPATGC